MFEPIYLPEQDYRARMDEIVAAAKLTDAQLRDKHVVQLASAYAERRLAIAGIFSEIDREIVEEVRAERAMAEVSAGATIH